MRTTLSSDVPPGLECLDFQHAGPSGQAPDIDAAINALSIALRAFVADDPILNLVAIRVAQLNHCAPSLATHIELAKHQGEHPMRLCHVSAMARFKPVRPAGTRRFRMGGDHSNVSNVGRPGTGRRLYSFRSLLERHLRSESCGRLGQPVQPAAVDSSCTWIG